MLWVALAVWALTSCTDDEFDSATHPDVGIDQYVGEYGLSSYLVWVGVKFSNAKEEELLINDASQIGSKKFDFSIE